MTIRLEHATPAHLAPILAWLKAEQDAGQTDLYSNGQTIANLFASDGGICAIHEGIPVGFVVFRGQTDSGEILIVAVHPKHQRQGIASRLMVAAQERLHGLEVPYIDVECTSTAGEALCRQHGFEENHAANTRRGSLAPRHLRKYV